MVHQTPHNQFNLIPSFEGHKRIIFVANHVAPIQGQDPIADQAGVSSRTDDINLKIAPSPIKVLVLKQW